MQKYFFFSLKNALTQSKFCLSGNVLCLRTEVLFFFIREANKLALNWMIDYNVSV